MHSSPSQLTSLECIVSYNRDGVFTRHAVLFGFLLMDRLTLPIRLLLINRVGNDKSARLGQTKTNGLALSHAVTPITVAKWEPFFNEKRRYQCPRATSPS